MNTRDKNFQPEQVIGRFWIDHNDPEFFVGYIDLGIFGRIKNCKLYRSNKRIGKEKFDSDYTISVKATETPMGMMRFAREQIEKALWEVEEADEGSGSQEGDRKAPAPIISTNEANPEE